MNEIVGLILVGVMVGGTMYAIREALRFLFHITHILTRMKK